MFFPRGILKNDISFISFASPNEEVGSLWVVLPSSCLLIGCWTQVAQSCPTLGDPVDCIAYQALQSMEFSRQEYWSGLPFPFPGDLPNPGIEPGSPALQADALPSEPPGRWGGTKTQCPLVTTILIYLDDLPNSAPYLKEFAWTHSVCSWQYFSGSPFVDSVHYLFSLYLV